MNQTLDAFHFEQFPIELCLPAKLYLRILRPNWAALLPDDDSLPLSLRAVLDQLDAELQKLHKEPAMAA